MTKGNILMEKKILYTPKEVQNLIENDSAIIIDVRDREMYDEGHIQGAVNVSEIFYYLAETTPDGLTAMHQKFEEVFSQAGVSHDKTVIVYEESLDTWFGGSCRGYWILTYLGHPNGGILDGGLAAWAKEGLPVSKDKVTVKPTEFVINPQAEMLVTKDELVQALKDSSIVLVDNRNKDEWDCETSSPYGIDFAPRMGRIPGAKWIEWYDFLNQSVDVTAFKTPEEITDICAQQGIFPDDDIILYCFKGARSSNSYVALKKAGFKKVRLYFGSWNEWSRDFRLPIDGK